MSYSSAPIAWCRDNLGIGGDSCLVRTQLVGGTRRTHADAWHARTDARLARGDARASPHRNDTPLYKVVNDHMCELFCTMEEFGVMVLI
jgi:hypothetical protein